MACSCTHCLRIKYLKERNMECSCGFKFAGQGEFRNCEAFVTESGQSGITCPECNKSYVGGKEVSLEKDEKA